ncbi:hypothetical protein ACFV1L_10375 [Kitasatospora sp. NPDC059646]|uniref:hypothetical protein n=1 Tax=Kitasatospora sp. NPDC059646 TaxID=3346893 RepID=UPI00369F0180
MLTEQEMSDLAELRRLLDEAYEHYFSYEGHCKSSEGLISLHFNTVHDRLAGDPFRLAGIGVYSYALGPHRQHDFSSMAEALDAVRGWHAVEMAHDPEVSR